MEYGTDLTKQAEEGRLDPVVGRAKEIERVTQILGRRTKVRHALSTSLHPGGWGNRVSSLSHGAYGRVPPHMPFRVGAGWQGGCGGWRTVEWTTGHVRVFAVWRAVRG